MTVTQDVAFTSWGFGVEGLSATVRLRGRQEIGDEFVWPRADDPLDLIVGYAQLNRDVFRIRLGRQRTRSGLGFDSFDGLDVLAEPTPWLRVEAFGGRSLARGLHETRHEALAGVEEVLPIERPYRMASREFVADRTVIEVGAARTSSRSAPGTCRTSTSWRRRDARGGRCS